MAADAGAGTGGGGNEPDAPPAPTPVPPEPKPEGETQEAKLTSAGNIIGTLFGSLKDTIGKLNTTVTDLFKTRADLKAEKASHATEKTEHQKTKDALKKSQDDLATMTGDRDSQKAAADRSKKHVGLLETFAKSKGLDVSGIDPDKALPAVSESASGAGDGADLWNQYNDLRQKESKGESEPGTAMDFWRKHQSALNAYAKSQKRRA
jgi:hypothetical protein